MSQTSKPIRYTIGLASLALLALLMFIEIKKIDTAGRFSQFENIC
jgi:hypothetical protein